MRLCQGYAWCGNAADVWWHGAWCARCAARNFGRVPTEMAKVAIHEASRDVARPSTERHQGTGSLRADPVLAAGGVDAPAFGSPAAPSSDEFLDLLDADLAHIESLEALVGLLNTDGWDVARLAAIEAERLA